MIAWLRKHAILLLIGGVMPAFMAMAFLLPNARPDAPSAAEIRLSEHCAWERTHLELLQTELRSDNQSTVMAAVNDFWMLADAGFREVKVCAPEGAPLDPGDDAFFCSAGNARNDGGPCVQAIVANMLLYVRGR